ncbi:MAG: type II toxin-antitoxin system HicB family antitoxin [Magnetococcales bacterium]|nr:type II toxin-antitoxin system HicB family antitoxin [Magnetococcales bacterium]
MQISVILEPSDESGYTATVPSLPGCISEGNSREDALLNIREAILLYLDPVDDNAAYAPESEVLETAV